jgi:hypothetical protein
MDTNIYKLKKVKLSQRYLRVESCTVTPLADTDAKTALCLAKHAKKISAAKDAKNREEYLYRNGAMMQRKTSPRRRKGAKKT